MLNACGLLVGVPVFCMLLAPAPAQPTEARAILDQGIKALGGAAKLNKLTGTTFQSQGHLLIGAVHQFHVNLGNPLSGQVSLRGQNYGR